MVLQMLAQTSQLLVLVLTIFVAGLTPSYARSWTDVGVPPDSAETDPFIVAISVEADPMTFTDMPSVAPSTTPTNQPSAQPTPSPTARPTWKKIRIPRNDRGYFNYNTRRSADYGPGQPEVVKFNKTHTRTVYRNNHWREVQDSAEQTYWKDFQKYIKFNLNENACGRARQSPIDVRPMRAACEEHHEIRHRPGDFRVDDYEVKKQILPSKLRLLFPRRVGEEPDPPHADFPNGFGGKMDALHADVKLPSEHWVAGKQYVAEYQIMHLHQGRQRAPVISILVDIHPQSQSNLHFQKALDEWQKVFDADKLECEAKKRRDRRLDAILSRKMRNFFTGEERASGADADNSDDFSTWADEPPEEDVKFQNLRRKAQARATQPGKWDPYHEELMRSIHFFGYSGSLTEPPCTEFLEWRVIDAPMLISEDQLAQMQDLLFNHVDKKCSLTSNHFEGSVARPIQDANYRNVYQCTCRDFISDDDRKALDGRKCSEKELRAIADGMKDQ